MSNNRVVVTLNLKDLATPELKRFSQAIDGLERKTKSIGSGGSSSFKGLTGSIATAAIAVNALEGAFNLATSAAGGLFSKFKEAADVQGQTLTSAGSLMALAGFNFNEATQYLDQFSASMARVANDLPGQTSDYVAMGKGLTDNLIPAFQDLNGVLDRGKFDEYLKGITTSAGFLASVSGTDIGNASLAISKALSGKSVSELSQIKFFEANPAVLALIEQEAQKMGGDLKDLTDRQRAEVVRKALERATPKEVLDAARESASGLVQRFLGQLFDPQTGVFGLLRDLNPDEKINQNAFDGLQKLLKALFGEDGLTDTIGGLVSDLNLGDPMVRLRNNFLWLRDKVNQFTLFLKDIKDSGLSLPSAESINRFVESLPQKIGSFFERITKQFASINLNGLEAPTTGILNSLLRGLAKVDYSAIFINLGKGIANVVNTGADIVAGLDLTAIVSTVGGIALGVLKGIGTAVAGLDANTYAVAAVGLISSGVVLPFLGNLAIAVAGITFAGPVGILVLAAGLAMAAFAKSLTENWDELIKTIGPWFNDLGSLVGNSFGLLFDVFTGQWSKLQDRVIKIVSAMGGLFQGLYNTIAQTLQGYGVNIPTIGEARAQSAMAEANARYDESVKANGGATVKGFVPNRADGFTAGLIQAAVREGQRMPSGAGIVVANSSEQILNRQQQSALSRTLSNRGNSITVKIGSIVSQATDSREVAREVIRQIDRELQEASRMLASAFG